MFPPMGDGPEAEKTTIEICKNKFLSSWHADPCGHYVQILDSDKDDAVVAAAYWGFYNNDFNPFLHASENNPSWFPEGSEIWKYTKMTMDQGMKPKIEIQGRPHAYLGMVYTDPVYRRHGAASMLMEWGMKKADEMGIGCFLDSTAIGIPFYESLKFVMVDETPLWVDIENPSEEWKRLQAKYTLHIQKIMWRPAGGNYQKGEKYPWEA